MIDLHLVLAILVAYFALLFVLALYAERRARCGRCLCDTALVYTLGQTVYVTGWTFYGDVGTAARSGMFYLASFFGPTLTCILAWSVWRKLVRIKEDRRITSVADFVSARFGKSQAIGFIVASLLSLGLLPYLALQFRTIIGAVALLSGRSAAEASGAVGAAIVIPTVVFTILMGLRRVVPTERHPGVVAALVVDAATKLLAVLAVGVFVTYFRFHGLGDIFSRAHAELGHALPPDGQSVWNWLSYTLLSGVAILLLPRQFHMAVVENSNERHILTSMWLLPLYLLGMSLFTLPIALGGLLLGLPIGSADTFMLAIPLRSGNGVISALAVVGGFAASMGMIVVETMAIATMASNHILLPAIGQIHCLQRLRSNVLPARWVLAALVIAAAYFYELLLGKRFNVAGMGYLSMAAVLQLGPATLAGLYWRRASRAGALWGLAAGFFLWAYTLVVPALVRAGIGPDSLLAHGPWDLGFLRPEGLFGTGQLDPMLHAVFWSLFFNSVLLVLGSLLFPQEPESQRDANAMVDILGPRPTLPPPEPGPLRIDLVTKRARAEDLLCCYFGPQRARQMVAVALQDSQLEEQTRISVLQLADFEAAVEKQLAASISTAAAHAAIRRTNLISPFEARALAVAYARILSELHLSPDELRHKVDYYRQRERLLQAEARRQRALAEVGRRLSASLDYETIALSAVQLPVDWLARAALLVVEDLNPGQGDHWRWFFAHTDEERARSMRRDLATAGLERQPPELIERAIRSAEVQREQPWDPGRWPAGLAAVEPVASSTLPLVARNRRLGALTLLHTHAFPPLTSDELMLAEDVFGRCAIALDNASSFWFSQAAVRARDSFIASAAHELRTPLQPVVLQVQMLRRILSSGPLASERLGELAGLLGKAEEQLRHLVGSLDRLLEASRVRGESFHLVRARVSLLDIVETVLSLHQSTLHNAGCEVVREVPPDIVGTWDRLRVEQILTNLLTNAAKYAPGKPIEIRGSAHDGFARLSVRDHGPGIALGDQARIFRPFERAISPLRVGGMGLGLYISQRLADAHGGSLKLDSVPGQGSTFTIELPID